ncbi:glycosyltransferase 87 family protein [Gordonia sinesedis]
MPEAADRQRLPLATRTIGWPVVVVLAALTVVVVIWHLEVIPIHDRFYGLFNNATDLRVYRAGARTVLDDQPLYRAPMLWGLQFTYPPFSALTFIPAALVDDQTARILWWLATFAALVAVVLMGFRSLGYRVNARLISLAVLFGVCTTALEPVRTTFWLGQINIFLMFLVVADLVYCDLRRPASRLRGIGVGIAAGLKLTPAFFVVYLAAMRRWRAAAVAVAAFAGTVLIGFLVIPGDSRDYWVDYLGSAGRVGRVDSPANQSINGFISQLLAYFDIRRFADPSPTGPVFAAPAWLWVPVAVVAALLGLWAAAIAYRRGWRLLSVTIAGMTAAVVSPFSWGHHWVWLVPLLVVAFDYAYRGSRDSLRGWARWLLPAGIVLLSFTWWWNWFGVPRLTSDHAMALGLFMMPRWPDPEWFDYPAVVLYSGCYPLILLLTVVITLVADRRTRRRHAVGDTVDEPAPGSLQA